MKITTSLSMLKFTKVLTLALIITLLTGCSQSAQEPNVVSSSSGAVKQNGVSGLDQIKNPPRATPTVAPGQTPRPNPEPTPTPIATPVPKATPTPIATATPKATPTATPNATPTATPPQAGVQLYATHCAACHGNLAVTNRRGRTATQIKNAIASVASMNSIRLTDPQINSIALALAVAPVPTATPKTTPTPTPIPTASPVGTPIDGQAVYNKNCMGCHGAFATSTRRGATAQQIQTALNFIPQMSAIKLTTLEIAAVAKALSHTTPVETLACSDTATQVLRLPTRRLANLELRNIYRDLFGATVFARIQPRLASLTDDKMSIGGAAAFSKAYAKEDIKEIINVNLELGTYFAQNRQGLVGYSSTCISTPTPDATCVKTLIRGLGYRAFRRPLSEAPGNDEVANFFATYTQGGTPLKGLQDLFLALFLSPNFLLAHYEGATVSGANVSLTQFDVAAQIALSTISSIPDAALLTDAVANRLSDAEVVRGHVKRLMASTLGRANVKRFFTTWLKLNEREVVVANTAFLNGIVPQNLTADMVKETLKFVDYTIFDQLGGFQDLNESKFTFATNPSVAKIMETPAWTSGTPQTSSSPWRKGLFTRPVFFLSGDESTNPVVRGAFYRIHMLCEELGDPPAEAAQVKISSIDPLKNTMRQRYEALTSGPKCIGCHREINPVGFSLEAIDSLGRVRTTEAVYKGTTIIKSHQLNTQVEGMEIDGAAPGQVSGHDEFFSYVSKSPKAATCLARQMFRGLRVEIENDADNAHTCLLKSAQDQIYTRSGKIIDLFADLLANQVIAKKRLN